MIIPDHDFVTSGLADGRRPGSSRSEQGLNFSTLPDLFSPDSMTASSLFPADSFLLCITESGHNRQIARQQPNSWSQVFNVKSHHRVTANTPRPDQAYFPQTNHILWIWRLAIPLWKSTQLKGLLSLRKPKMPRATLLWIWAKIWVFYSDRAAHVEMCISEDVNFLLWIRPLWSYHELIVRSETL